ncbi:DEAD/DEAH box helicase [Microvirga tunisiensis]|uniref:DEAD-box ATP-dependent RNA helicase RhpA n=1 Tax=Pannonibacter tanglangensis TaxID=2750084 RepID=A0A7X5F365_9HYPH|nr:DEAD/DEAH box helicase [Pannonibacter sp. XCT-53]NBN78918.1 DEAD/DEAH box helicase [Pannonibacter sp. XCT-53]
MTEFSTLGLSSSLLKAITAAGYTTPTPIQQAAIPHVLAGNDLMGLAQTGTGKTAAFGLPLVERLLAHPAAAAPRATRALILAPTRELVNQIAQNLVTFVKGSPLQVTTIMGGVSMGPQIKRMARGCDILVATPGRLIDLIERNALRLDMVEYLVLDEADQMLDLGFIHALRRIATLIPKKRQTLLFSATMPKQIEDLSRSYLNDPIRVEVAPAGRTADKVTQCVHFLSQAEKIDKLIACLSERPEDLSLVFARTKHGADKVVRKLVAAGLKANAIHGNKSQNQRDRAIKELKTGETRILVATDVAARGIDIPGVSHVYNFDLPDVPESYVHRIGRTARAGADGDAIAFCAPDEITQLRDIEKLTGIRIPVASGEAPPEGRNAAPRPARGRQGQSQGQSQGQRQGQGRNGQSRNGPSRNTPSHGDDRRSGEATAKPARSQSHGRGQQPAGAKPAARSGQGPRKPQVGGPAQLAAEVQARGQRDGARRNG